MLVHSHLPFSFWGKVLNIACHIQNKIVHKHVEKTLYEFLIGKKPNINYFKVWGCIAYVLVATKKRPKLGSKAIKLIFLDQSMHNKAYRFLNPGTNSIFETVHAIYFKYLTIKNDNSFKLEKELLIELNDKNDANLPSISNSYDFVKYDDSLQKE